MTEPYLILHKVRGEPAFDIAAKICCKNCGGIGGHGVPDFETGKPHDYEGPDCGECEGLGYWWIIPTSGHRAYPYWHTSLTIGISGDTLQMNEVYDIPTTIPPDTPDHYACNDEALKPKLVVRAMSKTDDFLI